MELKLGDKVIISGYTDAFYREFFGRAYRVWRKFTLRPTEGIIVRKAWKRAGVLGIGTPPSWEYEGSQTEFKCLRQHLVYEVAVSLHRKPLLVCPSQIRKADA